MANVTVRNGSIFVGEKRINLFSGEVHYWRLAPECWSDVLDTIKEMNLEVVATYIPWEFHELPDGKLDFTGSSHPRRNLVGFLELARQKGLLLIIRPGPYIYSEWVNCGVPDRMVQYHRMHPEFQNAAALYIRAVTDTIKPYFATSGGNIFLLQPDNEIDAWVHWYGSQLGLDGVPGLFQTYLVDIYKDIDVLNRHWRTNYTDFNQARVVCENIINEKGYLRSYIDYKRFLLWYSKECASWTAGQFRDAGVDIPLYFNFYPWFDTHQWREFQEIADIVGVDLYPASLFEDHTSDHRKFCQKILFLNTFSAIPYIAEFECGTWHGHHYYAGSLGPSHYRLMCFSALACGVKGWNWYMLVNRDNWYMSPINEWGRKRPELFSTFCEIMDVIDNIEPSRLERVCETSVTFDYMHRIARTVDPEDPVLCAMYDSDVDFEYFDTETGKIQKRILFYSGSQWLSREAQQKILQYVEAGGIFVSFQIAPNKDEDLNKLNLLQIKEPDLILPRKYLQVHFGPKKITVSSSVFHYQNVAGETIQAMQINDPFSTQEEVDMHRQLSIGQKYTCGYVQKAGKGRIMVLGLEPTEVLIRSIHEYFGIPVYVRSETPSVKATAFRDKEDPGRFVIIVLNNGSEDKHAKIVLNRGLFDAPSYMVENLVSMKSEEVRSANELYLTVFINKKDGVVLNLTEKER